MIDFLMNIFNVSAHIIRNVITFCRFCDNDNMMSLEDIAESLLCFDWSIAVDMAKMNSCSQGKETF